jgi:hypothetical protein
MTDSRSFSCDAVEVTGTTIEAIETVAAIAAASLAHLAIKGDPNNVGPSGATLGDRIDEGTEALNMVLDLLEDCREPALTGHVSPRRTEGSWL